MTFAQFIVISVRAKTKNQFLPMIKLATKMDHRPTEKEKQNLKQLPIALHGMANTLLTTLTLYGILSSRAGNIVNCINIIKCTDILRNIAVGQGDMLVGRV